MVLRCAESFAKRGKMHPYEKQEKQQWKLLGLVVGGGGAAGNSRDDQRHIYLIAVALATAPAETSVVKTSGAKSCINTQKPQGPSLALTHFSRQGRV